MDLLSATNPENGTVSYTYNSDHTLHTKTDAKSQVFTYSYDGYRRLTQIMVGSTVLRTFTYDTDSTGFSGSYTQGRLVSVQHTAFTPQGYLPGIGGSNITVPSSMNFIEQYDYSQAGQTTKKRLQVNETMHYYTTGNVLHDDPKTVNLDATYTYNNEGQMTSVKYPPTASYNGMAIVYTDGPTYTYSFDAMHRPTGLTDQNSNTIVNNVTYNAANQLLTFNTETRTYNNLNQMTRLQVTGNLDISYNFPAGTNNGKISTQTDNLSGETVTYQYDSLNRLLSASSSQSWSETYGFDGFGNLLSKTPTGGAPTLSQAVDAATNHIVGQSYDGNGNQTSSPLGNTSVRRGEPNLGHERGSRAVQIRFAEQAHLEEHSLVRKSVAGSVLLQRGRPENRNVHDHAGVLQRHDEPADDGQHRHQAGDLLRQQAPRHLRPLRHSEVQPAKRPGAILLPLRRRSRHNPAERFAEVRNLYAGYGDWFGLCGSAILCE